VKFTFKKRHPIRAKATGHPRIVTVSRPHPRRNRWTGLDASDDDCCAIWLPITALLYMGTELLNPKGTDQLITTTGTASR